MNEPLPSLPSTASQIAEITGASLPPAQALPIATTPASPPPIQPTAEQQTAIDSILAWFSGLNTPQQFKLGGYAGTGKTTVLKLLKAELRKRDIYTACMAFTGKACSVLQRKGVDANTIHSSIYFCEVDPKTGEYITDLRSTIVGTPDLIIVDEASMISTDLYRDLLSFKKKILFVGDPGQLEPVGDNPNLMKQPDLVLKQIHRQAAESPIICLANNIRQGSTLSSTTKLGLVVKKRPPTLPSLIPEMLKHDQTLCATNRVRTALNLAFREYAKLKPYTIELNDRLICLRNNRQFGVFNGMIMYVVEILEDNDKHWLVKLNDEFGKPHHRAVPIWKEPFERAGEKDYKPVVPQYLAHFDFGYCITVHKSQGSEWDRVLVYDEWMPPTVWDMKRWRYTAFTRASKELTVVTKY